MAHFSDYLPEDICQRVLTRLSFETADEAENSTLRSLWVQLADEIRFNISHLPNGYEVLLENDEICRLLGAIVMDLSQRID